MATTCSSGSRPFDASNHPAWGGPADPPPGSSRAAGARRATASAPGPAAKPLQWHGVGESSRQQNLQNRRDQPVWREIGSQEAQGIPSARGILRGYTWTPDDDSSLRDGNLCSGQLGLDFDAPGGPSVTIQTGGCLPRGRCTAASLTVRLLSRVLQRLRGGGAAHSHPQMREGMFVFCLVKLCSVSFGSILAKTASSIARQRAKRPRNTGTLPMLLRGAENRVTVWRG
jgi:hypothetical protein